MELERGFCNMCMELTRVFKPPKVDVYSDLLPNLFEDNFLPQQEYEKIKMLIKLCAVCCYKIQLAVQSKKLIDAKRDKIIEYEEICHFCKTDQNLIVTRDDWKFFTERTQGLVSFLDFPLSVCIQCLHFYDILYTVKKNFILKFPQLGVLEQKANQKSPKVPRPSVESPRVAKSSPKHRKKPEHRSKNDSRKRRKSICKSPISSKQRKFLKNCFTHLQPLVKSTYHVNNEVKDDAKMYRAITYIKLHLDKLELVEEELKTKSSETNKEESKIDRKKKDKVRRSKHRVKPVEEESVKGKNRVKDESTLKETEEIKSPVKNVKSPVKDAKSLIKEVNSPIKELKSSLKPKEDKSELEVTTESKEVQNETKSKDIFSDEIPPEEAIEEIIQKEDETSEEPSNEIEKEENKKPEAMETESKVEESSTACEKQEKQTPKERPIIKIKLGPKKHKDRKHDKEKRHSQNETPVKHAVKTKGSLKRICTSEEPPKRPRKALKRNSLNLDQLDDDGVPPLLKQKKKHEEVPEQVENLEETPKAPASQELVPKRRVSLFVDDTEELEEISDSPTFDNPGDLNEIMQGFIKDSTFNENDKLDLLDEIEKNVEESSIEASKIISEENGLKDVEYINGDHETSKNNGENSLDKDLINDPYFGSVIEEDAKTIDSGSERGSTNASPEKFSMKIGADRDSLDGSEKKKKRVHFSDDVADN